MRNLKRVLSLALASVMLLGMMVIGAGAADYTDNASITQIEAAQVLEAIEVMTGNDKGEFLPTADLTREAAAKIITYMLLGKKGADDLSTGKAPFDDVEATRWSAGSIAYCANAGIISGDGKGNFFPTATVTGVQFAKMLLGALGYKAEYEGFTGPNYVMNVTSQVISNRLNKGIDSSLNDTMTREEAARMALNTLTSFLVEYTGGIDITTGDAQITSKPTRRYMTVAALDGEEEPRTFMSLYQPTLKYDGNVNGAYGRPSHRWTEGKDTIGTYPNELELSYTSKPSITDLKNDLTGFKFSPTITENGVTTRYSTEIWENGVRVASDVADAETMREYMGAGRLVEVYANNVYAITKIIVVDSVLAQVSAINTTAKEVRIVPLSFSGTLPGKTDTGAINGGTTLIIKETENKNMYAKLAEMKVEDYVLVTFNNGKVASVAVPETITGTYTAQASNGKRTIGGNTYDDAYSARNFVLKVSMLNDQMDTFGTDYLVYMDAYGNPIYATDDATTNNQYGYVLDTDYEGSKVNNTQVWSAKVLFADGTQQWIKVSTIDHKGYKDPAFENTLTGLVNNFISYYVRVDGSYAISTVSGGRVYDFDSANIERGKVDFLSDDRTIQGNAKTVFLVGDGTYKAYAGIRNVPSMTGVEGRVLFAGTSGKVAAMVYITTPGTLADKEYVYILKKGHSTEYVDGQEVHTYDAIVNGKIDTIKTTTTIVGPSGTTALDLGLYSIAKYSGDYVAEFTAVTAGSIGTDGYIGKVNAGQNLVFKDDVLSFNNLKADGSINDTIFSYMTAEGFSVIGYDTVAKTAYTINASQLKYYNIKDFRVIRNDEGMVTTLIFDYTNV